MVELSSECSRKIRVIALMGNAIYYVSMQNSNKSQGKRQETNLRSVQQNM